MTLSGHPGTHPETGVFQQSGFGAPHRGAAEITSFRRIVPGVLGADRLGPGFHRLRPITASGLGQQVGKVFEALRDMGMRRPERLLPDRQRALEERLGFGILALGLVQSGEVVEALADVGMRRPERLLHDRQGALIERLGLAVEALGAVQFGEVVEAGGETRVLVPECFGGRGAGCPPHCAAPRRRPRS